MPCSVLSCAARVLQSMGVNEAQSGAAASTSRGVALTSATDVASLGPRYGFPLDGSCRGEVHSMATLASWASIGPPFSHGILQLIWCFNDAATKQVGCLALCLVAAALFLTVASRCTRRGTLRTLCPTRLGQRGCCWSSSGDSQAESMNGSRTVKSPVTRLRRTNAGASRQRVILEQSERACVISVTL